MHRSVTENAWRSRLCTSAISAGEHGFSSHTTDADQSSKLKSLLANSGSLATTMAPRALDVSLSRTSTFARATTMRERSRALNSRCLLCTHFTRSSRQGSDSGTRI